jgi:uncharacterized protein (DUF1778 family)
MAKVERESINFKLPKSLADALRSAALLRNTTATDLVIQGLHHILGDVPGVEASVEVRLYQLEEEFFRLTSNPQEASTNQHNSTRLTALEEKIELLANRQAQFEGMLMQMQQHLNTSKSRSKSGYPYPYNSQPLQLEPFEEKKLAMRLNTSASTLQEKRTTLNPQDFEIWSRERDPSKRGWKFNEKDGLYHPLS